MQRSGGKDGTFAQRAMPLAHQLLQKLEEEHVREVVKMYEEQIMLRQELQRVTELMTTEMIPREKMLHDMFEKINNVYAQATQHLHGHVSSMSQNVAGASGSHDKKRQELMDPLKDTERELQRIQQLLKQPVQVPPDLPRDVAAKMEQQARGGGYGGSPPRQTYGGGGFSSPGAGRMY